jgi:iron complex outermembrane receptor protein
MARKFRRNGEMDDWRLACSYSLLQMRTQPRSNLEIESPQHQFQIHSYVDLPHNLGLNAGLYFVDQVSAPAITTEVPSPSYVRLDLGVTWRPIRSLEIGIWGQNLQSSRHSEFTDLRSGLQTEVPRTVYGKITWRF